MKLQTTLLGAAVALLPATGAHAAVIAYDGFDYAAGDHETGTLNGGEGWAANSKWTGTAGSSATISSPGLSYPNLQTTGGRIDNTTANWYRSLANAVPTDEGGSIWFSVLASRETVGNVAHFAGLMVGFNSYIDLGTFYDPDWRLRAGGVELASGVTNASTALLVARIDFDAGITEGNEAVHFWVNPTPGSSPSTATVGVNGYIGVLDDVPALPGDIVRGLVTTQTGTSFDEFRIGESFADVTPLPEPTSLSLLALAGAATLRRRRVA